jgi:ATP-dependent RNA helicase RhlE
VDGDAVSLVCVDEARMLLDIERVLGHTIPTEVIEGFEPDPRIRPEPILRGGLGGARPSGPRLGGGSRFIGSPRSGGAPANRPADAGRSNDRPRPNGAPRPGSPGRHGAAQGVAGPRRPGQGIGNGQPGGQGYGPRPGPRPQGPRPQGRPQGRPAGGHARPDQARGPHRGAGPGIILPGERLARDSGRPQR